MSEEEVTLDINRARASINEALAELPRTMSADKSLQGFESRWMDDPLEALIEEKLWYLQSFLNRKNEMEINRYVMSIAKFQGKECFFIGDRNYDKHDEWFNWFGGRVLLTICFIVELFRKYADEGLRDQDDPIFNVAEILPILRRSLISFDTQVPLYLLVEFFNVTADEGDASDKLVDLTLHFFENMVGHTLKSPHLHRQIPMAEIKHLLDLIHYCLCPPRTERNIPPTTKSETEREFIHYASELEEFGIKFKKDEGDDVSLLNITFKGGEMKIPSLKVAESTFYLLKNLIKYEKKFPTSRRRYVSDYIKFMLCLINSPEDVKVLRRSGIIENWMGNDKVIFKALEDLGSNVDISRSFTYSRVLKEVNEHCRHRRNQWIAKLWRNYFNSPWSFISFTAAVVLLLVTITQTIYSILSYHYK